MYESAHKSGLVCWEKHVEIVCKMNVEKFINARHKDRFSGVTHKVTPDFCRHLPKRVTTKKKRSVYDRIKERKSV